MSKLILMYDHERDTPVHIIKTLVNEIGLPVSQAEQLMNIMMYKNKVCIAETKDTKKMLFAVSVLNKAKIKYKVI